MRRIRNVFITTVVISCITLALTSVASAAQAKTEDITYHGIRDKNGGCTYTMSAPAGTHGKSIHSDPASCTMVMERQSGRAPDAPPVGVVGPKTEYTPSIRTSSGGSDPTTQGHLQVWTWDADRGTYGADDSLFAYLQWSWDGNYIVGTEYMWPAQWANNAAYWFVDWYNNTYYWGDSGHNIGSASRGQFHYYSANPLLGIRHDTYNYVEFIGFSDGHGQCYWSVNQDYPTGTPGYQCVTDWTN